MAYRRSYKKRNYRRRTGRKKYVRFTRKRSYRRSNAGKPYYFKRRFEFSTITVAAGAAMNESFGPSLSDLPSFTDFTALFDSYRIAGLKVIITPNIDMNNVAANGRFDIYSVIDYNDVNFITVNQAQQYQNVKTTINTKVHARYFKPKIAISQTDINASSFVASYKTPWISTQNTGIAHGFMKVVSDVNPLATALTFTVNFVMYMQFKNVN